MTAILERTDLDDGEKVQLYDDAPAPKDVDDDVSAAVPKTMQTKAKRLMARLKKTSCDEWVGGGVVSSLFDLFGDGGSVTLVHAVRVYLVRWVRVLKFCPHFVHV